MFRTGLAAYIRQNPDDAAKVFASRDASVLNQYKQILGNDKFRDIQSTMLAHGAAQNIRGIVADPSRLQQGVERVAGIGGIGSLGYALASGSTPGVFHALAAAGVSGAGVLSNMMGNARARQVLRLAMSDDPQDAARLVSMARSQPAVANILDELNSASSRVIMSMNDQSAQPAQRFAGGRVGRASGGRLVRTDHAARAASLIRAAEAAKKAHNRTTEDILEQPDEAVAKALSIANKAI
jgi:hypothetical protein